MEDNGKQAGRDIVPGNHPSLPQIPVSIRNPQDITREVLNFLPREQAEGLAKMAATELLRLQLREVESQKSCVEVEQKIDQAIRWATTLADQTRGADGNFQTEHKDPKGTTRISVQLRPVPPVVHIAAPQGRQASGSCFVATACFGDYDHSTVMVLRQFRDLTLMGNGAGRAFITFYYWCGPQLARFVERVPVLKPPIRWALGLFAGVYAPLAESRAYPVARFPTETRYY